tara:strand:- start:718 stop:1161 length:444 start_codon:yes stop_codon:yes gene_type:complete
MIKHRCFEKQFIFILIGICRTSLGARNIDSIDNLFRLSKKFKGLSTKNLIEESVKAPDVSLLSPVGLWDGRPSLGGVWVEHPNVKMTVSVIVRNATNTGATMQRMSILPTIKEQKIKDKRFWQVTVGPISSLEECRKLLKRITSAGF